MYSDKVEVLRFETEPYRKLLDQNGTVHKNGSLHYIAQQCMHNNNNNNNNGGPKHFIHQNGYHTTLIESDTNSPVTAPTVIPSLHQHVQPPSDPVVASVLHPRQNPRPGRLLLENVNNRPRTMDRGTQANTDDARDNVNDPVNDAPATVITEAPSTSNNDSIINNELYRNANISVSEKKLLTKGGDDSSVDSLNSADSAKQDSDDSVIERAEFHQPMITKDDTDGHIMSNGNGKFAGAGGKLVNCVDKEHPVDDEANITSCGMECLYFAMQCCECSIM